MIALHDPTSFSCPCVMISPVRSLPSTVASWASISRPSGLPPAPISRFPRHADLSRIKDLEPKPPVSGYERTRPSELLHNDIKKLSRFATPDHRATGTHQNCRNLTT